MEQSLQTKEIERLKKALYYESQFRTAFISGSLCSFEINLSKDLIENDFFMMTEDNQMVSVPEYVGLKIPFSYDEFNKKLIRTFIPDSSLSTLGDNLNIREKLLEIFKQGKREYSFEYWSERKNGKPLYINQKYLLIQNDEKDIIALSIVRDLTNTVSNNEITRKKQIEKYAYYDPITEGFNYIKFKEKLQKLNIPGNLISFDIQAFKIINSICGISKGDQVIKEIWKCLMNIVEIDNHELAARINADQFVVFTPETDSSAIIQKIKGFTFTLNLISGDLNVPLLKPYFGITKWTPQLRVEQAYNEAVAAKQKAKTHPNLNYAFFETQDTEKLIFEKQLSDSFEEALSKKNFKIWYQPKYNPYTEELVGAEALVRWQKDDGTLLPPGVFIPLFERNGMIRILDEYIFRNVCIQQKQWKNSGKKIVPISINLSRASLYYKNVVNQYTHIANEIGIETNMVPIEITESATINNEDIKKIIDEFHQSGFDLHMDDFGTGYSSLSTLNQLQFETLKLDKSLIDYIGNYGGNRLIEHTISLAKELGLHVTAEGVENKDQVTFLNNIGCDSIQGYYFSKPIPANDFSKIITSEDNKTPSQKTSIDYLDKYVQQFQASFTKPSLYSLLVDITDNFFYMDNGTFDWHSETGIEDTIFDSAVKKFSETLIAPEYKDAYLNFMNRTNILEHHKTYEKTRMFDYEREFLKKRSPMRLMTHTFEFPENGHIMMYISISLLS